MSLHKMWLATSVWIWGWAGDMIIIALKILISTRKHDSTLFLLALHYQNKIPKIMTIRAKKLTEVGVSVPSWSTSLFWALVRLHHGRKTRPRKPVQVKREREGRRREKPPHSSLCIAQSSLKICPQCPKTSLWRSHHLPGLPWTGD